MGEEMDDLAAELGDAATACTAVRLHALNETIDLAHKTGSPGCSLSCSIWPT